MRKRPATALIALTSGLAMGDAVEAAALDRLIDSVAGDAQERIALLSGLRRANDPEIALLLPDLLEERAVRLREGEEGRADLDAVVGVWSQRVVAGGAVLAAGALLSGGLGGAAAAGAVGLLFVAGLGVAGGRLLNLRAKRRAARLRAHVERLAASLREVAKPG